MQTKLGGVTEQERDEKGILRYKCSHLSDAGAPNRTQLETEAQGGKRGIGCSKGNLATGHHKLTLGGRKAPLLRVNPVDSPRLQKDSLSIGLALCTWQQDRGIHGQPG